MSDLVELGRTAARYWNPVFGPHPDGRAWDPRSTVPGWSGFVS